MRRRRLFANLTLQQDPTKLTSVKQKEIRSCTCISHVYDCAIMISEDLYYFRVLPQNAHNVR